MRRADSGEVISDNMLNSHFGRVRKPSGKADCKPLPQLTVNLSVIESINEDKPRLLLTVQIAIEMVAERIDAEPTSVL